jgi:hypothetical protein
MEDRGYRMENNPRRTRIEWQGAAKTSPRDKIPFDSSAEEENLDSKIIAPEGGSTSIQSSVADLGERRGKRRRAATLQDAGARPEGPRQSARLWTAAALCRFGNGTLRLVASPLGASLLITLIIGCGSKELQFRKGEACWQATTKLANTPFKVPTIKIQVFNERMPTPPPRPDQLALIQRVRESLPKLVPIVIQKLGEYDEDLKDPKMFREQLIEPSISLFSPDETPSHTWSFTIERPSHGAGLGYHLEFVEMQFKEIWAGD